jgi:hypothetical protein
LSPPSTFAARLLSLWRGEIPLASAFWRYAIIYGTLANLFATLLTLALLSAGTPGAIATAVFLLPLPYNILAGVGVWRSAGLYTGNPLWARLGRLTVVLWAVLATLA